MIERRLFYLQTRLDAAPRVTRDDRAPERRPFPGTRVYRLLGGQRRADGIGGAR
jgi:hypothetical protein